MAIIRISASNQHGHMLTILLGAQLEIGVVPADFIRESMRSARHSEHANLGACLGGLLEKGVEQRDEEEVRQVINTELGLEAFDGAADAFGEECRNVVDDDLRGRK